MVTIDCCIPTWSEQNLFVKWNDLVQTGSEIWRIRCPFSSYRPEVGIQSSCEMLFYLEGQQKDARPFNTFSDGQRLPM